jgi:hypothetical protein
MPSSTARRVAAILEIRRCANGELPTSLISAAYRASQFKPVMLVLDSVSPEEVDNVLDPIVAASRHHLCGVIYVRKNDEAAVLTSVGNAVPVFASSEDLCAKLAARGIAFDDVVNAEDLLFPQGRLAS